MLDFISISWQWRCATSLQNAILGETVTIQGFISLLFMWIYSNLENKLDWKTCPSTKKTGHGVKTIMKFGNQEVPQGSSWLKLHFTDGETEAERTFPSSVSENLSSSHLCHLKAVALCNSTSLSLFSFF